MWFFFAMALLARAFAVCGSPTGVAGQFQYNTSIYQVCDGNAWTSMAAAAPSGACSGAGVISYGTAPRYCNGSLYTSMAGTETGATCSATAGTFQYNPTLGYMQYCDGTNLKAMRSASAGISFVSSAALMNNNASGITTGNSGAFSGTGNVVTGNTLVCGVYYNSTSASVSTLVASGSQALTRIVGPIVFTSVSYRGELWMLTNVTGSTGTRVTATMSAAVNTIDVICAEYSGLNLVNTLDKTASKTDQNNITVITAGPVTTTTAKELLVGVGCWSTSNNTAAGSGYTGRTTPVDDCMIEDRMVTAIGSYSASLNGGQNSNVSWGTIMMATLRGK